MRENTADDIAWLRRPWVWELGNRVLYDLCKHHPAHRTDDEVVAKVWLIGRSYAASIERRRNADRFEQIGDDFYEVTVAPTIRMSGIDSWIAEASLTADPASPAAIVAHNRLMDLFESITALEKRSLASKYLHFHVPGAFFIYDSRARQAITKVVPRLNSIPEISAPEFDLEYKAFTRRCVWLREHVRKCHGTLLTPREIDKLLLKLADDQLRARRLGEPNKGHASMHQSSKRTRAADGRRLAARERMR